MGVFTQLFKQDQRLRTQICLQMCLQRVLCERGSALNVAVEREYIAWAFSQTTFSVDNCRFRVTVVQSKDVFWVDKTVRVRGDPAVPPDTLPDEVSSPPRSAQISLFGPPCHHRCARFCCCRCCHHAWTDPLSRSASLVHPAIIVVHRRCREGPLPTPWATPRLGYPPPQSCT